MSQPYATGVLNMQCHSPTDLSPLVTVDWESHAWQTRYAGHFTRRTPVYLINLKATNRKRKENRKKIIVINAVEWHFEVLLWNRGEPHGKVYWKGVSSEVMLIQLIATETSSIFYYILYRFFAHCSSCSLFFIRYIFAEDVNLSLTIVATYPLHIKISTNLFFLIICVWGSIFRNS